MKSKRFSTIITILLLISTLLLSACNGESEPTEEHIHDWSEASCSAPKTCLECEETEGDPLPHNLTCGYCSDCKYITEAAMYKIDSATKGAVIIKWTLN